MKKPLQPPALTLAHMKTSTQFEAEAKDVIYRHWFEWSDRRQLGPLVLRLELLYTDDNVLTRTSIKMSKVTVKGHTAATETDPTGLRHPDHDIAPATIIEVVGEGAYTPINGIGVPPFFKLDPIRLNGFGTQKVVDIYW